MSMIFRSPNDGTQSGRRVGKQIAEVLRVLVQGLLPMVAAHA